MHKPLMTMHKPLMTMVNDYSKCPKILNTLLQTFLAEILLFMQLFLKILSGMVNSVDPDQTAPSGAV